MAKHIPDSTNIALCSIAINDTFGPEGLMPSSFIFEMYPATDEIGEQRQPWIFLQQWAQLANAVRLKMYKRMASVRVDRALHHNISQASDVSSEDDSQVYMFREKQPNTRIGKVKTVFSRGF